MFDVVTLPVIRRGGDAIILFAIGEITRTGNLRLTVQARDYDLLRLRLHGVSGLVRFGVDKEAETDLRTADRILLMEVVDGNEPWIVGEAYCEWDA